MCWLLAELKDFAAATAVALRDSDEDSLQDAPSASHSPSSLCTLYGAGTSFHCLQHFVFAVQGNRSTVGVRELWSSCSPRMLLSSLSYGLCWPRSFIASEYVGMSPPRLRCRQLTNMGSVPLFARARTCAVGTIQRADAGRNVRPIRASSPVSSRLIDRLAWRRLGIHHCGASFGCIFEQKPDGKRLVSFEQPQTVVRDHSRTEPE